MIYAFSKSSKGHIDHTRNFLTSLTDAGSTDSEEMRVFHALHSRLGHVSNPGYLEARLHIIDVIQRSEAPLALPKYALLLARLMYSGGSYRILPVLGHSSLPNPDWTNQASIWNCQTKSTRHCMPCRRSEHYHRCSPCHDCRAVIMWTPTIAIDKWCAYFSRSNPMDMVNPLAPGHNR